jgi:UDP-N-acetylmuramate--alanine ligase
MDESRLRQIIERAKQFQTAPDDAIMYVDPSRQELLLCRREAIVVERFAVSTALLGLGNREGSNRTPTGFHRVCEKIGAGAPPGRIFRDRNDTGIDWRDDLTGDNAILSRILRLEGLEPGLNKGPGIGSFERYIYLHGTNQESKVGTPLSHGCVCLRNADVIRLFDRVEAGSVVFIDAFSVSINGHRCSHLHFAGLFGSGMSAIAQYLRWQDVMVSGSDRLLTSSDTASVSSRLSAMGCNLSGQDGSGITASTDAIVVSSAIEESNPDIAAARARNLPVFHRSDVLAAIVSQKKTIAIAGTSGKSTVTAMVFEFLNACGKSPSLISGAALRRLENEGLIGNARAGASDLLVVEADESDGTLVKYHPAAGVVLNISRDHKALDEILSLFKQFASQSAWSAVNADDRGLDLLPATERFGTGPAATWRPDGIEFEPLAAIIRKQGLSFRLPLPGRHNAENLCAALCVCEHFGCTPEALAEAVRDFQGVARRFAVTCTSSGICVIDDFAHNPAKIAAAVSAARGTGLRIAAIYQPHGFGPTRFLKNDYIETFRSIFKTGDSLYLLPIYYAGGTAKKDISSQDIIDGLGETAFYAAAVPDRDALLENLRKTVNKGDCVLLMGARDPSLPGFAKKIMEALEGEVI